MGGETSVTVGVSDVRAASDPGLPLQGVKPGGGRGTSGVALISIHIFFHFVRDTGRSFC